MPAQDPVAGTSAVGYTGAMEHSTPIQPGMTAEQLRDILLDTHWYQPRFGLIADARKVRIIAANDDYSQVQVVSEEMRAYKLVAQIAIRDAFPATPAELMFLGEEDDN